MFGRTVYENNFGKRRKTRDAHAIRAPSTDGSKSPLCVYLQSIDNSMGFFVYSDAGVEA